VGVEPPPYIRADGPHSNKPDRYRSIPAKQIEPDRRAGILASRDQGGVGEKLFRGRSVRG
jgi:hypothetical protein